MLERLEDLGVREAWRLAEPLAVAGVDEAWLAEVAELAGPGDRRRAALGGRVADRARAWPPTCTTRPRAWATW